MGMEKASTNVDRLEIYGRWLEMAETALRANPFAYLQTMPAGPVRDMLGKVLQGNKEGRPVSVMDFDRQEIGIEGTKQMCEALRINAHVTDLNFNGNFLG